MNLRPSAPSWPIGSGEMARCIRAFNWSGTPLGALDNWPSSLRSTVDLLLPHGFAMIALWGTDLIQIYNDGYRKLMGPKHPAGLGQPTRDCWPEVWHINKPIYDRVWEGETFTLEDALYPLARSGAPEEIWLTLTYSPLRLERGEVAGILVTIVETTERHVADERRTRSEAALRESEARLAAVLEVLPVGVGVTDADGRVVMSNAGMRRFMPTGILPSRDRQRIGQWKACGPDGGPLAPEDFPAARGLRGERTVPGLKMLYRDDEGEEVWTSVAAVPLRDEEGGITGQVTVVSDIDAIQRSAEALRESEVRLRALVTAGSYSTYRMSADWEELLQLEGAGFLADTPKPSVSWLNLYIEPADRPKVLAAIRDAAQRKGTFELEHRVRRSDGRIGWTLSRAVPIFDRQGEIVEWFGAASDITDRREAEARLRELNETLESRVAERTEKLLQAEAALRQSQKMEAVGKLTGGVAHDFNNLLTIIRSSIDLLRRPNVPEDRRKWYLDAVSDTVDRAARLTGQLLAFARRQALKPEVLNVADRLRGVADMVDSVTGARVTVVTEMPEHPCFIKVDLNQFETALINMAVNARDAMNGEGMLTLRLTCGVALPAIRGHGGAPGPFARIALKDTGCGIAPEHLEHIFEPFFTTKDIGKGTGLGLSQVFGFAKQSGGDVDVASEPDQGATFTIYLPQVEIKRDQVAPEAEPGPAPGGADQQVLIVEDNVEVGRFAKQILEDLGYQPTLATNAEEALEMLKQDGVAFEAVFSDVVMPGMGGIALAKLLRARFPNLPVILTTGYSHVLAEDTEHGFELLQKPYSAQQLSRVLRRVTGAWRTRSGRM